MKEKSAFHLCLLLLIAASMIFLIFSNKTENIPSVFFSGLAAFFAFHAYLFTKEKFRLDLLEKRWSVYEDTLKFCSTVMTYGGLPSYKDSSDKEGQNQAIIAAIVSANESFRGIGYHKTRSMFGQDIHDLFSKLNESYSWIISHQNVFPKNVEQINKESTHIKFIWETINALPDLFKPYVYFGDYRSDQ